MNYKIKPYVHQVTAIDKLLPLLEEKHYCALLAEMGTGKSKIFIDISALLKLQGKINGVIIIAPNTVTADHAMVSIPEHMSDDVDYFSTYWRSTPRKWEKERLQTLIDPSGDRLGILVVNYEALRTPKFQEYVNKFFKRYNKVFTIADESHLIKNCKSQVFKAALKLGQCSAFRLISSGSSFSNSPLNLFGPLFFLDHSILGFPKNIKPQSAYKSFEKRYAVIKYLEQPCHSGRCTTDPFSHICSKCSRFRMMIPMVVGYRRLNQLKEILEPISFTVNQSDCLDLPERTVEVVNIKMAKEQQRVYDTLKNDLICEVKEGTLNIKMQLDAIIRLRQIAGGSYTPMETGEALLFSSIPKMDHLLNLCLSLGEKTKLIVWANFRSEIQEIYKRLSKALGENKVLTLYGDTNHTDREFAKKSFFDKSSEAQVLVANPSCAGVGTNLIAAEIMVVYSLDYDAIKLEQLLMRNYRIGQKSRTHVVFLVSENTIDAKILTALRNKKGTANHIAHKPVDFLTD